MRVPKYVPQASIRWIVGQLHVSVSNEEVEADIRKRLSGNKGITGRQIFACIRYALACHEENRKLYRAVMSGRL